MSESYDEPTDPHYVANVSPDDASSNQQRQYPYLAGTQPVALLWVGQVYDQFTEPVRRDQGGKK